MYDPTGISFAWVDSSYDHDYLGPITKGKHWHIKPRQRPSEYIVHKVLLGQIFDEIAVGVRCCT